jgi:uncharacterized protein (TIGR03067 family)
LRPVLDEEVERLPAKFRAAVVLCYLEGLKVEEAARQLNCPRGTILSRLARARQRLSARLALRGLALSTALLGLVLTRKATATSALPAHFVQSTVHAACRFTALRSASSGKAGGRSNQIAQSVLLAMLLGKLKFGAVCLLVTGIVVVGTATAVRLVRAAQSPKPTTTDQADAEPDPELAAKLDQEKLQGSWRQVGLENAGGKADPNQIKGFRWIFKDDGFTMADDKLGAMKDNDGNDFQFRFRLDANARPKRIELSAAGQMWMIGVYEFDGDIIRLCTAPGGGPWPADFAPNGSKTLWTLKRDPAGDKVDQPKKP